MSRGFWAKPILTAVMLACASLPIVAQDMIRFLDLGSDDFTKADMTRGEIEAALAAAEPAKLVDFSASASTA